QALSSAMAGLGRTVLPLMLAESALAKNELAAVEGPMDARRAYWLLAPLPQWRQKKVRALADWLTRADET
ncbi:LysR substrate-binding domain-containing protein, partial [Bremerella sp. JC817]